MDASEREREWDAQLTRAMMRAERAASAIMMSEARYQKCFRSKRRRSAVRNHNDHHARIRFEFGFGFSSEAGMGFGDVKSEYVI